MENNNMNENHPNGHDHCCHGYGYGHGPKWLRLLLGLIILLIVFWLGMHVGRFSAEYGGYRDHRMPYYGGMMYEGPGMPVPMMKGAPANSGTTAPVNSMPNP